MRVPVVLAVADAVTLIVEPCVPVHDILKVCESDAVPVVVILWDRVIDWVDVCVADWRWLVGDVAEGEGTCEALCVDDGVREVDGACDADRVRLDDGVGVWLADRVCETLRVLEGEAVAV